MKYKLLFILGSIIILLGLIITFSFGNPFLTANPLEDIHYYVISIDGQEFTTNPSFDMAFLYDLKDISDGRHILKLTTGHLEYGEGKPVIFFLIKTTRKRAIIYRIRKSKRQQNKDPYYDDRFDEPLTIRIRK